jgi:hypothetical protein
LIQAVLEQREADAALLRPAPAGSERASGGA